MRLCKVYTDAEKNETAWGVLKDHKVALLVGEPYEELIYTGEEVPEEEVSFTVPADPTKIVCIGRNYYEHIKELENEVPEEPMIFLKPTTALTDPEGSVERPDFTKRFDFEGEIAVVFKKKTKNVKKEEALDYILGYTCLNDITARDIQKMDDQWTRGKGLDGSAPVGPTVATGLPHNNIRIRTYLNGELRQDGNTSLMMWDIPSLIEYVSRYMTLLPGDILTCGTPANVGPMEKGDTVVVEGEGIGRLVSHIV